MHIEGQLNVLIKHISDNNHKHAIYMLEGNLYAGPEVSDSCSKPGVYHLAGVDEDGKIKYGFKKMSSAHKYMSHSELSGTSSGTSSAATSCSTQPKFYDRLLSQTESTELTSKYYFGHDYGSKTCTGNLYGYSHDAITPHIDAITVITTLIQNKTIPTGFDDYLNWASDCNPVGKSVLGPIKNQGQCGSCWAFGTNCIIEAKISMDRIKSTLVYTNNYVSLSEQFLLNHPDLQNKACNGGLYENAVPEIASIGAIATNDCPYMSQVSQSQCNSNKMVINTNNDINGFVIHLWNETKQANITNEVIKKLLLIYGPLVTAIYADNNEFRSAKNSIIKLPPFNKTRNKPDHQVVLMGCGKAVSSTKIYWIIRNSWGRTDWGINGYGAIEMVDDPTTIFAELGAITKVTVNDPSLINAQTVNEPLNSS